VVHICNPNIKEVEVENHEFEGSLGHRKTVSKNKKTKNKKNKKTKPRAGDAAEW
jgi:hypothetical protein